MNINQVCLGLTTVMSRRIGAERCANGMRTLQFLPSGVHRMPYDGSLGMR
jgi:hypothetical protein